jgi:hypothetical protein
MMDETRRSFSAAAGPVMVRAWAGLAAAERRAAERPELFRLLLEMVPLSHNNPALRAQMQHMYDHICDQVAEMVTEVNQQLPTPLPVPARDFAGVVMAAIDGLAVRGLVEPEADLSALYRALGFLLLSSMMSSYAAAGLPMPPLHQMSELLGIPVVPSEPPLPVALADASPVDPPPGD